MCIHQRHQTHHDLFPSYQEAWNSLSKKERRLKEPVHFCGGVLALRENWVLRRGVGSPARGSAKEPGRQPRDAGRASTPQATIQHGDISPFQLALAFLGGSSMLSWFSLKNSNNATSGQIFQSIANQPPAWLDAPRSRMLNGLPFLACDSGLCVSQPSAPSPTLAPPQGHWKYIQPSSSRSPAGLMERDPRFRFPPFALTTRRAARRNKASSAPGKCAAAEAARRRLRHVSERREFSMYELSPSPEMGGFP